ncbi:unnamed protein product [Durusdinium trenchii]|uniref:Uncharacterized protein n=1 Tax=Durusdinium trenchii TaxID=1381693 RepID=A0ABP0PHQ5_9DINO
MQRIQQWYSAHASGMAPAATGAGCGAAPSQRNQLRGRAGRPSVCARWQLRSERGFEWRMSYASVLVRDARQVPGICFQQQGFQILPFKTQLKGDIFLSKQAEVQDRYYEEVCRAIQEATGADCVLAFHHNVRHQRPLESTDFVCNTYDYRVHGDYTPESAREVFEWQLPRASRDKSEVRAFRDGHFLLVNAWRNLSPEPVENDHLAVCDAKSISEDHLLMMGANSSSPQPTALRRSPCLTAENFTERVSGPMARFDCSSEHRWYYYPKLREDELLIFKCYDSTPDTVSRYVLHSAMRVGLGRKSRESIEVRAIAFFQKGATCELSVE